MNKLHRFKPQCANGKVSRDISGAFTRLGKEVLVMDLSGKSDMEL